MKTLNLILICLFMSTGLFAQKIELTVQADGGLFHYSGATTASVTTIQQNIPDNPSYTNNPYGNKNGFSYGAGLQIQFITKGGFIAGFGTGYQVLRSTVDINSIQIYYPPSPDFTVNAPSPSNFAANGPYSAKGKSHLTNKDIYISPYVGYRINLKAVKLDLMPGFDIAFNLNSYDKGHAVRTDNDATFTTNLKKPDAPTDVRIKFGAAAYYGRYGVTASFAHGLTNYESSMIGDAAYKAYSNLLSLGLSYRLL